MLALGLALAACGGDEMSPPCNEDACLGETDVTKLTIRPRAEAFKGQPQCQVHIQVNNFLTHVPGSNWLAPGGELTVDIDPAEAEAGGKAFVTLGCPKNEPQYQSVFLFFQNSSHILVTF